MLSDRRSLGTPGARAFALLFSISVVAAAPPPDDVDLRVDKGEGGSIELTWTGDSPPYEIYRSESPEDVVGFGNRDGETNSGTWVDTPPSGQAAYYVVNPTGRCIYALADATIDSNNPNTNFGGDPYLQVSEDLFRNELHVLARFDLSRIPEGATIDSARVQLLLDDWTRATYATELVTVDGAWSETGVTWNTRPSMRDVIDAPSHTSGNEWQYWDATALVQEWVDGARANHGIALRPVSASAQRFRAGDFRESEAPRLCVSWTERRRLGQEAFDAASAVETALFFQGDETSFASGEIPVGIGSEDSVVRALDHLYAFRDLYGLDDPQAQLFLDRVIVAGERDEEVHMTFGQRLHGREVYGAQVEVRLSQDRVIGFGGNYLPAVQGIDVTPERTALSAREAAAGAVGGTVLGDRGEPALVYFNEGLLVGRPDPATHLAYRFRFHGTRNTDGVATWWEVLVDAFDNAVLVVQEGLEGSGPPDKNFVIETVQNTGPSSTCWDLPWETADDRWFTAFEQDPNYPNPSDWGNEGELAWTYAHQTYDYYHTRFGRHAWNNKDGKVHVMVHAGGAFGTSGAWDNARFEPGCKLMTFGDDNVQQDVFAHEYSHAVDHFTAELKYRDESGAIDEHLADFFGSMLDFEHEDGDWTIDEGSLTGAGNCSHPDGTIRDMSNPPSCGDPDHRLASVSGDGGGLIPPPAGNTRNQANDFGGVHSNSGIPNKVGYLIAAGDTHNGLAVSGLGLTKAAELVYATHTERLHKTSDFWHYRNEMIDVARGWERTGRNGFTVANVADVVNAWSSVGYGDPDLNNDGYPDSGSDGDRDFLTGADDNCLNVYNPGQEDADGDGVGDACDFDDDADGVDDRLDNCPMHANPSQVDTNSDGTGDECDDWDGDGVLSPSDNCPNDANRWQRDLDGDGLGDVCDGDEDGDGVYAPDNCPRTPNPGQGDEDEDGHGDACDNCLGLPNDQADLDQDGMGDACDNDRDGDDLANGADNCPDYYNPKQADNDNNGVGLYCDAGEKFYLDGIRELVEMAIRFDYGDFDKPVRFPIFPCTAGDTCPDWIGPNFVTAIDVRTTPALAVRIVDDQGDVVASAAYDATGEYHLEFSPAPEYAYRSPATALVPYTDPAALDTYEGRRYFLEFKIPDGGEPTQVDGAIDVHSVPE